MEQIIRVSAPAGRASRTNSSSRSSSASSFRNNNKGGGGVTYCQYTCRLTYRHVAFLVTALYLWWFFVFDSYISEQLNVSSKYLPSYTTTSVASSPSTSTTAANTKEQPTTTLPIEVTRSSDDDKVIAAKSALSSEDRDGQEETRTLEYVIEEEEEDNDESERALGSTQELAIQVTKGQAEPHNNNKDNNMFVVLTDARSAAGHVMKQLDQQQHDSVICANAYPGTTLMHRTTPWIRGKEKGCHLSFVRESIALLVKDIQNENAAILPPQCSDNYETTTINEEDDELQHQYLPRLCNFIAQLKGDYSDEAISRLFVDVFLEGDTEHQYTACSCPKKDATASGMMMRGLKIEAEWILGNHKDKNPLHATVIHGAKMVRLTRRNLFERFMSFRVAQKTNQWNIHSATEKVKQLEAYSNNSDDDNNTIDVDSMLNDFRYTAQRDAETDQWAKDNAGEILWLDYSHLRNDPVAAFERIYSFLSVDDGSSATNSTSERLLGTTTTTTTELAEYGSGKNLLQYIENKEEVVDVLCGAGYGHFIADADDENCSLPVRHLIYDDSTTAKNGSATLTVRNTNAIRGVKTTVIRAMGTSANSGHFSARLHAALPSLQKMNPKTLVVLSDKNGARNPHIRTMKSFYTALGNMRRSFEELTRDRSTGAIIVSGTDGAFVAGKAKDMIEFITLLNKNSDPNDDGIFSLSSYQKNHPDKIIFDYEHKLFGVRFEGVTSKMEHCSVARTMDNNEADFATKMTSPFFVSSVPNSLCTPSSNERTTRRQFPMWEENGIDAKPILNHIDRLFIDDHSLEGIERHFGKEILYVVDDQGVWGSPVKRDKYRVVPTERFLVLAHRDLMNTKEHSWRWPILQKVVKSSVGFPYFAWYGDWKKCNFHNAGEDSVPVFTTCASTACNHSFPMPAYMNIIDANKDTAHWFDRFQSWDKDYPWESKKRQVVWRGSLSENNPHKVFDSARWQVCKLVHELTNVTHKDMFDVGLTNVPRFLTAQIDIDVSKVGGIAKGIRSMNDFQQYTAIMDMDGSSWSSRFGTLLCYNSVAIKVEPKYVDYFIPDLVPWKHYVPIKADLSDLVENMGFVLDPKNDGLMREIVASANQWCAERFTDRELAHDLLDIYEQYLNMMNRADPNWIEDWKVKKVDLFAPDNKYGLMKLD